MLYREAMRADRQLRRSPVCEDYETGCPPAMEALRFDCHSVSVCGSTVFCESPPPCEAVPV
jgi:hypothetical protein